MGNTVGDMCCKLRSAAQAGKKEECAQLIKLGAEISCQDNLWSSSALHEACRFGHQQVVSLLLKNGAMIDARDCIGHTPLFYASKGGFDSVVQLLLDHGADARALSNKGKTPLHYAFQHGHRVAALILLENGASLYVKDCEGNTPIQLAGRAGSRKCLMICHCAMESIQGAPHECIRKLVNLEDSELAEKARIVLKHWMKALLEGKDLVIPPAEVYDTPSCEPLVRFFSPQKTTSCSEKVGRKRRRSVEKGDRQVEESKKDNNDDSSVTASKIPIEQQCQPLKQELGNEDEDDGEETEEEEERKEREPNELGEEVHNRKTDRAGKDSFVDTPSSTSSTTSSSTLQSQTSQVHKRRCLQ